MKRKLKENFFKVRGKSHRTVLMEFSKKGRTNLEKRRNLEGYPRKLISTSCRDAR